MKTKRILKPFLPALAIIGLLLGCGGDKGTETPEGGDKKGGGEQGGGEKAASLATFLPGKRITFTLSDDPPEEDVIMASSKMLAQFELDGTLKMATVFQGKTLAVTDKKLTFKVDGLKVTLPNPFEEGEAILSFSSANPKVGDKFSIVDPSEPKGMEATISTIEKAGKLELMAMPEQGFAVPFGVGPNGERSDSKHPAFMVHTWEPDRFARNPAPPAIFGKDGALKVPQANGKIAQGTWEVAGPVVTLTYPNAKTGKEQSLKYRFWFGEAKVEGLNGEDIKKFETLNLMPAGGNHPKISYWRLLE